MANPMPGGARFRGHVDFFGYSATAGALVFVGWVSHPLAAELQRGEITVTFAERRVSARPLATFYVREALGDTGIGMVLITPAPNRPAGALTSLTTTPGPGEAGHDIEVTRNTQDVDDATLRDWVGPLLRTALPALPDTLAVALGGQPAPIRGAIDLVGHSATGRCWLASGWLGIGPATAPLTAVWGWRDGTATEGSVVGWYARADMAGRGVGFVALLPDIPADRGPLLEVTLIAGAAVCVLRPGAETRTLHGDELHAAITRDSTDALPRTARDYLLSRLSWTPYRGVETLGELSDRVLLEVDRTVVCPPHGLAIVGWTLAAPGTVRRISLCRPGHRALLDLDHSVRLPRPDVVGSIGGVYGFDEIRCGFIAFSPDGHGDAPSWLEIETTRGQLAYKPVPAATLHGMAAIRALLADCDFQFADVAPAFDDVLGPAIGLLNTARLRATPGVETVQYGPPPPAPDHSVVIPLYGRLDFMEVQAALFSRDAEARRAQIIFVLDDPPKRRDAENLAASIHARLDLPLTLLVLGRNVGFAPASNVGLAAANGRFVCFLNSDVFPLADGWLGRLAARLDADPGLGMVGPLLLHDDGTVQHQGIEFSRQPRYGNFYFGRHRRLARQPPRHGGVHRSMSVTGACLMLRTAFARRLGGFDEQYVVGDFEDTDLCLRARASGFASAVDLDVRLCHLGRSSQVPTTERWRMNLTLYNAWLHQRRWAPALDAMLSEPRGVVESVG